MTSGISVEALQERIAEAKKPKRGKRSVWTQPTVEDFALGTVLCFDQTLTKTGWSLVHNDGSHLYVKDGGVLSPQVDPALKSFEQTFAKAEALSRLIRDVMNGTDLYATQPDAVVHEMPAVMGYRLESSLMAAREIRRAREDYGPYVPLHMISRQHAYSVIVGHGGAFKSEGSKAVNALVPDWCRTTSRWTQDVHDSVILGLSHLYDKKNS